MPRPPMITGELRQWQLDDERCCVSGYIYKCVEPTVLDGTFVKLNFVMLTKYPYDYLIKTSAGVFYSFRFDQEDGDCDVRGEEGSAGSD